MSIAGDTAAGLLLSQLIYWTRRGVDVAIRNGWIFKTAHDWQQETGMSWKVQRRARAKLLWLDLIDERRLTMPARLEFRLKLSTLGPLLAERAEVEIDGLDLGSFRDASNRMTDDLLGRGFLFHGALARTFPVHSAMLCSRLLAVARLPSLEPAALIQASSRGSSRLVTLQRDEWRAETGLTRDQWQTARRNLREAGVLIERKHNFPRRIDLALDLRALADVLRQPAADRATRPTRNEERREDSRSVLTHPYRLDRVKQAGGIGHRPIPPMESADPANTDRPILPTTIAQSHLYLSVLQGSLHPPLQAEHPSVREPRPNAALAAFAWGGGGAYAAIKVEFRLPTSTAGKTAIQEEGVRTSTLIWPTLFATGDRDLALKHLAGLDRDMQQTILDEIDWMRETGKAIRSPVALARALRKRADSGTFVPDGAHRVLAARATAAEAESLRLREAADRTRPVVDRDPMTPETEAARARLKQARDRMARRRVA